RGRGAPRRDGRGGAGRGVRGGCGRGRAARPGQPQRATASRAGRADRTRGARCRPGLRRAARALRTGRPRRRAGTDDPAPAEVIMTSTDTPDTHTSGTGASMTDAAAYEQVERLSAAPLWRHYGNLFPKEPTNRARPHVWPYAELRRLALHFCRTLSLEEAERRVLMLVNPALTDPPATVNTLFAGIQIITPGETAQAHRHAAGAFRFIIEGSGAATTVNGERVHMHPGDLLLTPGWHWHDHIHEGDGPMMWLDGLD